MAPPASTGRSAQRATVQVVVPSLLSFTATPIAASASRARSEAAQSLAARAARRSAISASTAGTSMPDAAT